ncbi:MAG: hypothetical protein QNK37_30845 [Acidobacteriota bacterium]|nr:hypothetical protein [Acidobacteriota bacterium]
MITGAVHTLTPNLMQSLQDYRFQLNRMRPKTAEETPAAPPPAETLEPGVPSEKTPSPLDFSQALENATARRDDAKQAALEVGAVKQKQDLIDTYLAASSDDQDETPGGIEPVQVYKTSMKYSRRADLVAAFEETGAGLSQGLNVNMVV